MSAIKDTLESIRSVVSSPAHYVARLAAGTADLHAAQVLRYQVFNVELQEGLAASAATGRDEDPFDAVCAHVIVEHLPTASIVGTYRVQTGKNAAARIGYYCAQEFELEVFEPLRGQLIELGRACVHPDHRNLAVLSLLWKGVAQYTLENGGRYLFGCSSLTSQDPAVGATAYVDLAANHLAPPQWCTRPIPACVCPLDNLSPVPVKIPKLLRAYLSLGAKICGPPALDREFKTIDFLTWLDLETMPRVARQKFLGL